MKLGNFNVFASAAIMGVLATIAIFVGMQLAPPVSALEKFLWGILIFGCLTPGLCRTYGQRERFSRYFGVRPAWRGSLSAEDQYSVDVSLYLAKSNLKNFGYCVAKVMSSPETERKEANLARARLRLTKAREDFNLRFYSACDCGARLEHLEAYDLWPVPHPYERK